MKRTTNFPPETLSVTSTISQALDARLPESHEHQLLKLLPTVIKWKGFYFVKQKPYKLEGQMSLPVESTSYNYFSPKGNASQSHSILLMEMVMVTAYSFAEDYFEFS